MYCIPTSKDTGFPIKDSEANTRVENRAFVCGSSDGSVHRESPRISSESDLEVSVTTTSVTGLSLLFVMLKFRSSALPARMAALGAAASLALPALPSAGEPVIVVPKMMLFPGCPPCAADGVTLRPPSGGFGDTLNPSETAVDLASPFASLYDMDTSRF